MIKTPGTGCIFTPLTEEDAPPMTEPQERKVSVYSGDHLLIIHWVILVLSTISIYNTKDHIYLGLFSAFIVITLITLTGFYRLSPGEAMVFSWSRGYRGTHEGSGLFWYFPHLKRTRVSKRPDVQTFLVDDARDALGTDIVIEVLATLAIDDSAKYLYGVQDVEAYIDAQMDTAVKEIARCFIYSPDDDPEAHHNKPQAADINVPPALRVAARRKVIEKRLAQKMTRRLADIGMQAMSAEISRINYPPSLVRAMIDQRVTAQQIQQQQALFEAIKTNVETLANGIHPNNPEAKARLMSNLCTVLVGQAAPQTVIPLDPAEQL